MDVDNYGNEYVQTATVKTLFIKVLNLNVMSQIKSVKPRRFLDRWPVLSCKDNVCCLRPIHNNSLNLSKRSSN